MSLFSMLFEWPLSSGQVDLGLAFSDDGIIWTIYGVPYPYEFNFACSSDTLFLNGKYHVWYSRPTSQPIIQYAESYDMLQYGQPVVAIAREYPWETRCLSPSVVYKDGIFQMWYMAGSDIGYASSVDGKVWTKYPEPVVNDYYAQGVIFDGVYKMFASPMSLSTIHLLESTDGIAWSYVAEVLAPTPGSWDEHGVTSPEVLIIDDIYWMWYGGGTPHYPGNWQIGLATSTDGFNWVKHPQNPLLSPIAPRVSCGVPDIAYAPAMAVPSRVTGLAASTVTNNSLKLSWANNPPGEAIDLFRVYLNRI